MVVWLISQNGHGPVKLLCKDKSYHLMGERHLR